MLSLPPVLRIERAQRPARRGPAEAVARPVEPEAVEQPPAAPPPREDGPRKPQEGFQGPIADEEERVAAAPRLGRPHAPLVAQLIATALGFAQTRARRRASLAEAAEAYGRKKERPKPPRGFA